MLCPLPDYGLADFTVTRDDIPEWLL